MKDTLLSRNEDGFYTTIVNKLDKFDAHAVINAPWKNLFATVWFSSVSVKLFSLV